MLEFGNREARADYVARPSVYAIIAEPEGRVAVVRTPKGIFLPGGGIESGESAEQALIREVMEECGMDVRIGMLIGQASELVYSRSKSTHFDKQSCFFDAVVITTGLPVVEVDHELEWLLAAEALDCLVHESHAWGIEEWIRYFQ
ncbi:MAG: 8-oxo-dGTP diphosphatase [Planctomycetota bacterium]|jgi:8-oxo-dGTP diphosphatase